MKNLSGLRTTPHLRPSPVVTLACHGAATGPGSGLGDPRHPTVDRRQLGWRAGSNRPAPAARPGSGSRTNDRRSGHCLDHTARGKRAMAAARAATGSRSRIGLARCIAALDRRHRLALSTPTMRTTPSTNAGRTFTSMRQEEHGDFPRQAPGRLHHEAEMGEDTASSRTIGTSMPARRFPSSQAEEIDRAIFSELLADDHALRRRSAAYSIASRLPF